ncbi:MAG: hydroxyacid dehydrogenase [Candidatus Hodarchaeota archaeon]
MTGEKILITDNIDEKARIFLEKKGFEVTVSPTLPKEELVEELKKYDAVMVRSATKLKSDVLNGNSSLKSIGRAGAGLDNIDLNLAKEKGIEVFNSPSAHAVSVAEHTIALMLAITKHIPKADKTMKEGKWLKKKLGSNEVREKTLGIIGFGNIGQEVAKRALAFGMKIIVFDVIESCISKAKEIGCDIGESVDSLIPVVDYLTLHVPHNDHTHHLINKERLQKLKDNAIIINTARGKVIDQDALVEILKEGKIKGAALDVFRDEPIKPDDPILKLENVILTPHIASSTKENQIAAALIVAEKIADYFSN